MNTSEAFDAVILGESLAGLWAASKMLANGLKVMVVATGTASTQNVLPKFMVEEFELLHLEVFKKRNDFLQVLTKTRRVRIFQDESQFKNELEFQFGNPLSKENSPDSSFLRGLAFWVKGSEGASVLPSEWPSLYARIFETVYLNAAPGFVTHMLMTELEKKGAKVIQAGKLRRLFMDRKVVVGIQLSESSKMISVPFALANTQFDYINRFLNEPLEFVSKPTGWRIEMHFECDPDSLPVGITDRMVYVETDAPLLEIARVKPGVFCLSTLLPLQESTLDRNEQLRLMRRMLKVCMSIFPDLEYNLRKVYPEIRDPDRAIYIDLPALIPFQELKEIPHRLLSHGVINQEAGLPVNLAQGLWLTSEEVNPREGIWGGFEGAEAALREISSAKLFP